jgi:hypothetical protein
VLKNRVFQEIEEAIATLALEQSAIGQVRVANELRERGLVVSPAGVRCVWLRHDLETMKKRLNALETKSAQDGLVLSEAQLVALERSDRGGGPWRVRERASALLRRPGQFYIDILMGSGGSISKPSLIPTPRSLALSSMIAKRRSWRQICSMIGWLPFFDRHEVKLLRVLTDRGSEYCGNPEGHEYELYLAIEDIGHSRTKIKSPAGQ